MKNHQQILDRIKLLTNYDSSKTLNENKKTILEQQDIVNTLVTNFKNGQNGLGFARINGLIAILNKLPNNINSFISFYNGVNTQTKKSLGRHINELLGNSDAEKAIEIANILKTKFGITVKSNGVENNIFRKNFQFPDVTDKTSWGSQPLSPTTDPAQQEKRINVIAGVLRRSDSQGIIRYPGSEFDGTTWSQYVSRYKITQDEIYKAKQIVDNTPTKETTVPVSTPQKFDDVLNGRGVLRMGSKSPAVGELQQKLITLGYTNIGSPNNVFDNNTQISVEYFQNNNGLKPDKVVGKDTATKINQALDLKARRTSSSKQPVPTATTPLPTGGNITPPAVSGIQTK